MRRAREARVGKSKISRRGISTAKARRMRARSWVARREWPPRSKKLSLRSMESRLSRSCQMTRRSSETGDRVVEGVVEEKELIECRGRRLRSSLPLGVRGIESRRRKEEGIIKRGKRRARKEAREEGEQLRLEGRTKAEREMLPEESGEEMTKA